MQISNNYIVVEKLVEEEKSDFKVVSIQDSSLYKGKVINIPEVPVYLGNKQLAIGDVILFAKYSPDTHEIELEGKKVKFISTKDILAIYE